MPSLEEIKNDKERVRLQKESVAQAAGGQAFPVVFGNSLFVGITRRDYFAAKAMQAAATNPTGADGFTFEERAKWAYAQADAMIAEGDK
ncbi:hypothetical protein [Noviherbaspirillum suwonense]|uniref:Uncharacterized protein n=1 Tax=Noviherbaspirillum suwonense TaxID=1224511 RepID=A0ABY1QHK4_9BURK|nr:hypothetical protein [Noviherbaspirillum suwonense]SMP71762.1 hypothetical protein SAMN06295970_11770 [Noviherbaspirillum suwonense]